MFPQLYENSVNSTKLINYSRQTHVKITFFIDFLRSVFFVVSGL